MADRPNVEADFKAAGSLKTLEVLGISAADMRDEWLRHFVNLKQLDTLALAPLYQARISGTGFQHLQACPKLRMLVFYSDQMTIEGMTELAKLNTLQELNVSEGNLDDRLFKPLVALKNLQRLVIVGTKITDASAHKFREFPGLQTLEVSSNNLGDDSLMEIGRITSLRNLIIAETNITDVGLTALYSLANLIHFDVRNTKATLDGVRKLRTRLTNCEVVCDFPNR